jgi:transcriptional regulator with XRE-family HTH domain
VPPSPRPQVALGNALRQARETRGLSQEEVGLAAEVHPTWISHLEGGEKNPSWDTVARICRALGMPISELAALAERLEGQG